MNMPRPVSRGWDKMGQRSIAISCLADANRLRREVKAGSLATPGVYLTMPMNDRAGTCLAVPLDYYMVGHNRHKAGLFVTEMWNFRSDPIEKKNRFKEFERRCNDRWRQRSPEEWGLMLIMWKDFYQ